MGTSIVSVSSIYPGTRYGILRTMGTAADIDWVDIGKPGQGKASAKGMYVW